MPKGPNQQIDHYLFTCRSSIQSYSILQRKKGAQATGTVIAYGVTTAGQLRTDDIEIIRPRNRPSPSVVAGSSSWALVHSFFSVPGPVFIQYETLRPPILRYMHATSRIEAPIRVASVLSSKPGNMSRAGRRLFGGTENPRGGGSVR